MNATAFDLSPLTRSIIGFDKFSDLMSKAFANDVKVPSYPPYNIEKLNDDEYSIVMAVAGFSQSDLEITSHANSLKVSGKIADAAEDAGKTYLHRGIAARSFERSFSLADHVKVVDAEVADGLLRINLKREVPEESKPRQVAIKGAAAKTTIESKKK